jgi:hypothetical protein
MSTHNWVKTVIRCSRHRRDSSELCVYVDREIPAADRVVLGRKPSAELAETSSP